MIIYVLHQRSISSNFTRADEKKNQCKIIASIVETHELDKKYQTPCNKFYPYFLTEIPIGSNMLTEYNEQILGKLSEVK